MVINMEKIILTGIGADVEVFLADNATKQVISAEGYIQGTKDVPFVFDPSNKYFSTSLDNVLAEFTIPPAKTVDQFVHYLQKGMAYIEQCTPEDVCTHIFPAANLDPMFLQTEQALLFGCEPDVNAYTQWVNNKPACEDKTLRSAGGHIHIGYNQTYIVPDLNNPNEALLAADVTRQQIIKALDLFVGIPMVVHEPENKRKELYGKAGAYRPKTYGVEYRTLSNYYLTSKRLTKLVYNNTVAAIKYLNKIGQIPNDLAFFVQNVINTSNVEEANYLIKEFKISI